MKKIINYLKFISIFLIIELMLTFMVSLLNLLSVNSGITTIMLLISNIILFLILNYFNAKLIKKRGYLEGIILGLIFIGFMYLIKIIIYNSNFAITTCIYYLILLITSVFGGMFGVNKKSKN